MNEIVPLLKHNPSLQDPRVLEEITVQREDLIRGLVAAAVDPEGLRHQLIVGPRGMGKTHMLSLVASRLDEEPGGEGIVLAWLDEDPWAVRTYGKLVAAILRQVGMALDDSALQRRALDLRSGTNAEAEEGERLLREKIGDRRLLLLGENIDVVFRKIGTEGQRRFREFVDGWGRLLVFATSPQPFAGVAEESSPFYGFFEVTQLEELTVGSAMELMRRIARLNDDRELLKYLRGDQAEKRFRAIEALAGGHPRIWLLFSGCISVEAIDELVPLFLEALDDLTPYYQDRIRELGDQQQELVVLLSEARGALSNRELAELSGLPQNQIATMLGNLADRGYVRPAKVPESLGVGDRRMSFWELREPLMRLCLEVKQSRGEPLRMVIEFLRAWYGAKILDELVRLPAEATLAATYAGEVFRALEGEIPVDDLFRGSPEESLARAEAALSLQPDRFDFQVAKALSLMMDERFEEARDELERLREGAGSEGPPVLTVMIAAVKGALDEPVAADEVAGSLHEMRKASAEQPLMLHFVASVFAGLDLSKDAAQVYKEALALQPGNSKLHAGLGGALGALGRHEEAASAFEKASELDPGEGMHHHQRGVALTALQKDEEALEAFEKAVEATPESALFHVSRASTLRALGRRDEALAACDEAVRIEPEGQILRQLRAILLTELGRFEEALAEFNGAIELDPSDAVAYSNLGTFYSQTGRLEEALAAFSQAADREPGDSSYRVSQGVMLYQLDRNEEALAILEKALEVDPSDAVAWNSRGVALGNLERHDEALEAFNKAAELDPSTALFVSNRGSALGRLGRFAEAYEAFAAALELDPEDPNLYRQLGKALDDLGRPEEALIAFEKALAVNPEDAESHNERANSLHDLERFGEAEQAARQAIELDPAASVYRFTLAEVLLSSRDSEGSMAVLRDALAIWKGEPKREQPGEPDLICRILWKRFREDASRPQVVAAVVDAYRSVDAVDELGRGVVSTIPALLADDVEDREAEEWVEEWGRISGTPELEIPVSMLRVALAWKCDRDRAHLMKLPREQRQIVVDLLAERSERS